MGDGIEKYLRAAEDQGKLNPRTRRVTTQIRAILWPAIAAGDFPQHVDLHESVDLIYIHPDFEFHAEDRLLIIGSYKTTLTPSEAKIMGKLTHRPNHVVTREELMRSITNPLEDPLYANPKTIDVHVSHLRAKITAGKNGSGIMDPIETVRGIGYRLIDPSRLEPEPQP